MDRIPREIKKIPVEHETKSYVTSLLPGNEKEASHSQMPLRNEIRETSSAETRKERRKSCQILLMLSTITQDFHTAE